MKAFKSGRKLIHPILSQLPSQRVKKGKLVSAEEAVRIIRDGDTVATGGFVGAGFAEEIAIQLEAYFLKTGSPKNLTLLYAAGQGDGKEKGLNHLGHEGLVRRVIGGHIGMAPKLQKLIRENKIFGYNFPQGVVSHFFRDIAAHRPGTITTVGMGTFVDPRVEGGKINDLTKQKGDDLIEVIQIKGQEYLFYKAFPINVAIIRGTTADADGNITMEREALTLDGLSMAMAAKNSNGFVIAQVERIAERGTLRARESRSPGSWSIAWSSPPRESLADLCRSLQSRLELRDQDPHAVHTAAAPGRTQDHLPPGGLRIEGQQHRQPRHRHARRGGPGGQRGKNHRIPDADDGTRRDRRPAQRRPQLRYGRQHGLPDRSVLPVRLL